MGFITIGIERDFLGRPCEVSIHTDDMTDEDYYEYCQAIKEIERLETLRRSNKGENFYKLIGDGTKEQLTEAYRRKNAVINKYR